MTTDPLFFGAAGAPARFELRRAARELLDRGQPVKLGARAFDLLLALLDARGAVVSRDELFERAWPGRVVVDDNLKVQVMALRKALGAEAVRTVPGRGYRFGWELGSPAPATAAAARPPAASDLFGRDADRRRAREAIAAGRLVTLTGPGGIGKTRLAQALADELGAAFADGAVLIELAPLSDARMLPGTIARALRLPAPGAGDAAQALAALLAPLQLLLVLDNCEHLRDAAAALAQALLDAAPQVALLATSQEPLGLRAEQVLRLGGLDCPTADGLAATEASPAAALLVARARQADPQFVVDEALAPALAEVCRRLDGIPLALELAAARVPLLGIDGVLEHLSRPLSLLTRGVSGAPARQQTLRGAMSWSHGLLNERERIAFRRLGIFAGSFDLARARQVLATPGLEPAMDGWEVLDHLDTLVAKSLLQVLRHTAPGETGERRRYRLLESARQFALERLDESGEAEAMARAHAEAVRDLFEEADARLNGVPALPWTQALLPDLPNLRAALRWALGPGGDTEIAAGLAGGAGNFWGMAGLNAEAAPVVRSLQARIDDAWPVRTRALFWLAVANRGSDASFSWTETYEAALRAVPLARDADDAVLLHRALALTVQLALRMERPPIAIEPLIEEMRRIEGDDWGVLERRARRWCEDRLIALRGDWATYADHQRREVELLLGAGDAMRAWTAAHNLALGEIACGRADDAVAVMDRCVASIRDEGMLRAAWQQVAMGAMARIEARRGEREPIIEAIHLMCGAGALMWMPCHLADWLLQQGRPDDAARLLGWADKRYGERRQAPSDHGMVARRRAEAVLADVATAEQLTAWRQEGARWSDADAAAALLR